MLFVCYPKCGTCKKAEQYLKENNLMFLYESYYIKVY